MEAPSNSDLGNNDPSDFSRVADVYGPGPFIAWLLVAFTILLDFYHSAAPGTDKVSLDLVATLIYPVVAAGHLIVQVSRFPGPRAELWMPTTKELVPYTTAMKASTVVCRTALGIIFVLAVSASMVAYPVWPRKRLALFGSVCTWIAAASCVAGDTHISDAVESAFLFGITPLPVLGFPFCVIWLVLSLKSLVRRRAPLVFIGEGVIVLIFLTLCAFVCSEVYALCPSHVPRSKHSITELGQCLAVVLGVVTAGFSMHKKLKPMGMFLVEIAEAIFESVAGGRG